MSTYGNINDNHDGSKNMEVGFVKENGVNTTSSSLSVTNNREHHPVTNRPGPMFDAAGASLNFQHDGNPSTKGSLSVQHMPKFGNQPNASAGIGVGSDSQRVGVGAFATHTMPHASHNYSTVGARVDAQMGKVGAHAGIAHTPAFRHTEHSVGASLNLHQTPTSSLNLNLGSNRAITPNHTGNWNHGAILKFDKRF